ncbi:hypothetical protein [Micromonospora endolithica]|uniref:hypothetical protein n=1 Tax=Micromonospora endolithica TaxID=230091 RepID=UPI0011AE07C4|nr:hypothetical protein [Micromonospora endolithica]TWJ20226.1 hypothetical protein JD76_00322 [Micromonospora endolithica]
MNGRQVGVGVLLAGGGSLLLLVGGSALVAGDLGALPVLVLGGGLVAVGLLLARAGARARVSRPVSRRQHQGGYGYGYPPASDVGVGDAFDADRARGGSWWSGGDSGGGWSGGDSGGGFSGGDSGGGGGGL